MTASELRELLKGVPDDMEVVVWRPRGGYCAIAYEKGGGSERLPPPKSSGYIGVVEYSDFPGVYKLRQHYDPSKPNAGEKVYVLAPENPGPW